MLAMVKFSRVLLGWDPALTLAVCVGLALAYTVASGLWGVVVTDLLQFVAGMLGAMTLAGIVLTRFGGPAAMAEAVRDVPEAPPGALDLVPSAATASSLEIVSFLCLIGVLWLRSGQGDGYVAQRLFATRDERQAVKASLWFAFAGTVLLTWPWIVVGLGSLLVFPPAAMDPALAADPELAYPMMIRELMPAGLRGLMVATFLAAFMSTMDTHLCWGASYMVNDVYRRFLRKDRSERHYVAASRVMVVLLAVVAAGVAWQMESIQRGWIYIIELTAGVALVWLLRWYWWRVNAWAEIAAMAGSVLLANGRVLVRALDPVLPASRRSCAADGFLRAGDGPHPGRDHPRRLHRPLARRRARDPAPSRTKCWTAFYRRVHPGGWWRPGGGAHRRPLHRPARDPHVAGLPPRRSLRLRQPSRRSGTLLTGRAGVGALLIVVSLAAGVDHRPDRPRRHSHRRLRGDPSP